MREAISITTIFQIFILFVLLFTAIMCLTINNSNAFGVKDSIINVIEANDGNYLDGTDLSDEIVDVIAQTSYRTSGTCPDGYEGYNRSGNAVSNNSSDAAVCIRKVETTKEMDDYLAGILGAENVGTDDFVEGTYYQVVLFFQLDIPIIKQIFNFQTKGETRTIYNTVEAAEEAPSSINLPSYNNPGNNNPTTPGTANNVNPVRNVGTAGNGNTGGNNQTEDPTENEPDDLNTDLNESCVQGATLDRTLNGVGAVAFTNTQFYSSQDRSQSAGTASPGVKFTIIGESGDLWAIDYQGTCGWITNSYLGINTMQYITEASFNITNASSSIFKTSGASIPGLTGSALYSSEMQGFAPLQYTFAKVVKRAAQAAQAAGDRLVIYETYRPGGVQTYAYGKFSSFLLSNPTYYNNVVSNGFPMTGFLASSSTGSQHNKGCAVDVTLSGASMPTAMHELSVSAARFQQQLVPNTDVDKLTRYFTSAGASTISSEWWHYQGSCPNYYATFWSAVG